tara:strand:+ start:61512 stop:61886 length:375 start_codon:yes stop_codon:yes gene_type:complete
VPGSQCSGIRCDIINGAIVGDHLFEPAATQFSERLLYSVHDLSNLLNQGVNIIGAWMGEGMAAFTEPSDARFGSYADPPQRAEELSGSGSNIVLFWPIISDTWVLGDIGNNPIRKWNNFKSRDI